LFGLAMAPAMRIPTAQAQGAELPCIAWDISGEWQYRASAGGYGTIRFQQDAAGNLTGSYYNAATGGSGTFTGQISGTSFVFRTNMGEELRGTVSPDGLRIAGTFVFGNQGGVWQATGTARCLRRAPAPLPGTQVTTVRWGPFRYVSRPCLTIFPYPGIVELELEVIFYGSNLPDQVRVIDVVEGSAIPPNTTVPLDSLRRVADVPGGGSRYTGTVRVQPLRPIGVSMWELHRITIIDPWGNPVEAIKVFFSLIDPSGYIYDTTNNARIKGAVVSLFRQEGNDFVLWSAAQFRQENPQVSDVEGRYGWEVPEGDYQVRASKRCYADAQSGVMHIPPERRDVNIGLAPTDCSCVSVTEVRTADRQGLAKERFAPGEPIDLHVTITNTSQSDVTVNVFWTVTDPRGQRVDALSGTRQYIVSSFGGHLVLPGTIPADAGDGTHGFIVSLTYQNQTSLQGTQFQVVRPGRAYLPAILKSPFQPPISTPTATPTRTALATSTETATYVATRTPTATRTPFPPTATRTLPPATWTPTATPSPTGGPQPLYFDDFSDPNSGWPTVDDEYRSIGYLDGEYRILLKETNWYSGATPGFRCTDCAIEADVRPASAAYGSYGILFGITNTWDLYSFEITSDQLYALWKNTAGEWVALVGWTDSPYIHAGEATNHLRVVRNGSEIALYANGHHLTTISDSSFLGNLRVGLSATAYDEPNVDVRFDNFAVYAIGGTSSAGSGIEKNGIPSMDSGVRR